MLRSLERADGAADRRVHVGAGAGDHARGKGGRVELVLGVENQRGVHRPFPQRRGLFAVQEVQKMPADGIVIGLNLDAPPGMGKVVPIQQHRTKAGHHTVGEVASFGQLVILVFRKDRAQRRASGSQHVYRMSVCRDAFQNVLHHCRQPAKGLELALVGRQLGERRQLAVHQQVRDFLELGGFGEIQDVVAAIVQIVAGTADRTQSRVAGGNAGQGDGFLGFRRNGCGFAHFCFPFANSSSSLFS